MAKLYFTQDKYNSLNISSVCHNPVMFGYWESEDITGPLRPIPTRRLTVTGRRLSSGNESAVKYQTCLI